MVDENFDPTQLKTKNLFKYDKNGMSDYIYICKDSTRKGLTNFGLEQTENAIDFLVNSSWQEILEPINQIITLDNISCTQSSGLFKKRILRELGKNLEIEICKDNDFKEIMKYDYINFDDFRTLRRFNNQEIPKYNEIIPKLHDEMLSYFNKNTLFILDSNLEEESIKLLDKLNFICTPYNLSRENLYNKNRCNRVGLDNYGASSSDRGFNTFKYNENPLFKIYADEHTLSDRTSTGLNLTDSLREIYPIMPKNYQLNSKGEK